MFEKLTMKMVAIGLAVVLVLGSLYWIYSSIRESGYREATMECQQKFDNYQKEINAKLFDLQSGLQSIGGNLGSSTTLLANDMHIILQTIRKNPNVIIKDGKCVPSQTFLDSINQAINRANKK